MVEIPKAKNENANPYPLSSPSERLSFVLHSQSNLKDVFRKL
jgi:hypothetical protein